MQVCNSLQSSQQTHQSLGFSRNLPGKFLISWHRLGKSRVQCLDSEIDLPAMPETFKIFQSSLALCCRLNASRLRTSKKSIPHLKKTYTPIARDSQVGFLSALNTVNPMLGTVPVNLPSLKTCIRGHYEALLVESRFHMIYMNFWTFSDALSMVPHHGSALPALAWVESSRCNLPRR